MNKTFIGLLIVAAAGAGVFFYLRKKEQPSASFTYDNIVGQWKLTSVTPGKESSASLVLAFMALSDSNARDFHYEFTKQGAIISHAGDAALTDTGSYEWQKDQSFHWKEKKSDTTFTQVWVTKLNADTLQLIGKDSLQLSFIRSKK